jgi:hypothetical protein
LIDTISRKAMPPAAVEGPFSRKSISFHVVGPWSVQGCAPQLTPRNGLSRGHRDAIFIHESDASPESFESCWADRAAYFAWQRRIGLRAIGSPGLHGFAPYAGSLLGSNRRQACP